MEGTPPEDPAPATKERTMTPRQAVSAVLPLAAALAVLALVVPAVGGGEGKKGAPKLPGKATWDLRAFNVSFRVVSTNYDPESKQVTWVVETKEGQRTADFQREVGQDRPYVFTFLDADMDELATVRLGSAQFKGIPKDRVMAAGTRLSVVLDVPDVMDKTSRVVLRRGSRD
jgi:hypothetical protein